MDLNNYHLFEIHLLKIPQNSDETLKKVQYCPDTIVYGSDIDNQSEKLTDKNETTNDSYSFSYKNSCEFAADNKTAANIPSAQYTDEDNTELKEERGKTYTFTRISAEEVIEFNWELLTHYKTEESESL